MKYELIETLKAALPVGFLAAMIRVLLHPDKRIGTRITIFSCSLFIAALVGIWVNDMQVPTTWRSIATGGAALVGKEILETIFEYTPTLVKTLLRKKLLK